MPHDRNEHSHRRHRQGHSRCPYHSRRTNQFQEIDTHFVNIFFDAEDVNLTDVQLLELARIAIQTEEATISSYSIMQERPLVVSIPVEGVFSCRHSIYEAAQEMVMAVQGSARVGDAGLQRGIIFRGILPYDDEEVEEDSQALARW